MRSLNWKVPALLMLMALPGVVLMAWRALPLLVDATAVPVPMTILQLASAVQGAVMVAVAAAVGAVLAPRVGLAAPAVAAITGGRGVRRALRPQWGPGLVGGCLGAAVLVGWHALAPAALVAAQPPTPVPLAVRVLYGGVTEEVLVRWGVMTVLVWAGWRVLDRGRPGPSPRVVWSAIALSALAFGVLHLPSVAQVLPTLSADVVAYVTLGNACFGLVAGYLYWRRGLEAAIAAHVLAHVLAYAVRG